MTLSTVAADSSSGKKLAMPDLTAVRLITQLLLLIYMNDESLS